MRRADLDRVLLIDQKVNIADVFISSSSALQVLFEA